MSAFWDKSRSFTYRDIIWYYLICRQWTIHIFMYLYDMCIQIYVYILHIYIYIHICISIYVYTYTYMHIYIYIYSIHMYVYHTYPLVIEPGWKSYHSQGAADRAAVPGTAWSRGWWGIHIVTHIVTLYICQ